MESELLYMLAQYGNPRAVAARLYQNAQQSLAIVGATALTWNSTEFSTGGMTVNGSGITVPIGGIYVVTGKIQWSASTSTTTPTGLAIGSRGYLSILINGVGEQDGQEYYAAAVITSNADVSSILHVPAGGVISLQSNLNGSGSAYTWPGPASGFAPRFTSLAAAYLGS